MSLYEELKLSRSEEDVKDAYIRALGLKGYSKNLIDIQTEEIWFEAKDTGKHSTYEMFTQLMHYVQDALNRGHYIPPFLSVIDTHKAAIMKPQMSCLFSKKRQSNGENLRAATLPKRWMQFLRTSEPTLFLLKLKRTKKSLFPLLKTQSKTEI